MCDEISRSLEIDENIESYQPFFDHSWTEEIVLIAKKAPKLAEFVFDLTLSIKGISYTTAIPALSVDVAESYVNGHNLGRLSNCLSMRLVDHFVARIEQEVVLSGVNRSDLRAAIHEFTEELYQKVEGKSEPFPKQELWNGFVKPSEQSGSVNEEDETPQTAFRLSLWSCQRICYSSLFFAYEDFLLRCLNLKAGSEIRVTPKDEFNKTCRKILGDELAESCWFQNSITNAKKIRHALAHAGGRETEELKKVKHGIHVVDGILQIMPGDTTSLFELIKNQSKRIAEWALTQPEFR